jgi:ABC-type branched-subunit amino acid transport system substrate-binding protein
MLKRNLTAGVTALVIATALAACGGSSSSTSSAGASASSSGSSSSSKGAINVLDITATSGATAIFGQQETLGMQAAAAYYNAHGGILGRKVNIVVKNDNSDPTTATQIATHELASNASKYSMVWVGEEGTVSAALIPIVKRYNLFATAVNDGNSACLKASACPTLFTQAGPIAAGETADTAALKAAGYTNVGVIAEQGTYDQSELQYMLPDLKAAGIKYTEVTFPPTAVSLTPEMSQLKSSGAQAVFAMTLGPAGGYVLSGRAALGWNVPVQFDVAGSTVDVASLVPKADTSNVKETIQYCEDIKHNNPGFNAMVQYAPTKLAGNIACPIAGDGWGGIVLLANAAKAAGSLDANSLIKATEGLDIKTNEASSPEKCWTAANHEDTCQGPSYYEIVPLGSLKQTRVYPLQ